MMNTSMLLKCIPRNSKFNKAVFNTRNLYTFKYCSNFCNQSKFLLSASRKAISKNSCSSLSNQSYQNTDNESNRNIFVTGSTFVILSGLLGFAFYKKNADVTYCKENFKAGEIKDGLRYYTEEEVKTHNKISESVWVSFKNGVYDITKFIESHPGGEKILLAAGLPIEPFWEIYNVHDKDEVYEMLESYRIGNLKVDVNKKEEKNKSDPFQNDPKRHPLLKVLTQKPFNAEAPKEFMADNLITPNKLHYVRNHLPVPKVEAEKYELEIIDDLKGKKKTLKLEDLKNIFPVYTIPVTLQCSGNKRKSMNDYESGIQGLMWDIGAISTAEWTGVKLKDVLAYCEVDFNNEQIKHIQFEGLDKDPSGVGYGSSIPKEKAFNEYGDVLIAFKMNGEDLPPDFGFPLRVVVPGIIGARSVKWLKKIIVSNKESASHWQQNDYKVLPPDVKNLKQADFSKQPAVQESPIQSAICEPVDGSRISSDSGSFKVKGYAYSGGGKSIDSVNVSLDNGKTWKSATLNKFDSPLYRSWAWTLWELDIDTPENKQCLEIVCSATDSDHNTQPETPKSIWNIRGVLNNSWHKIKVEII